MHSPLVKFASIPRVVQQWAGLGCFYQRDPPQISWGMWDHPGPGAAAKHHLRNLARTQQDSPCCGSKGKHPLRWGVWRGALSTWISSSEQTVLSSIYIHPCKQLLLEFSGFTCLVSALV